MNESKRKEACRCPKGYESHGKLIIMVVSYLGSYDTKLYHFQKC
jgi:hypothetical protein